MSKGRQDWLTLMRWRVSAFAALSALSGHALSAGRLGAESLLPALGVFLCASGASALNQWQERALDSLMVRTGRRPLVRGVISVRAALAASIALVLMGLAVLSFKGSLLPAALASTAVLVYNGAYTPLKRKTGFAILAGAVAGALSPAIGWVYEGEGASIRHIALLCFLFYLWQVPHFWALMLKHAADYRRAGFPVPSSGMGPEQAGRVGATWTFATGVAGLLLPLFGVLTSPAALVLILLSALFMFCISAAGLLRPRAGAAGVLYTNAYMLIVLAAVLTEAAL